MIGNICTVIVAAGLLWFAGLCMHDFYHCWLWMHQDAVRGYKVGKHHWREIRAVRDSLKPRFFLLHLVPVAAEVLALWLLLEVFVWA